MTIEQHPIFRDTDINLVASFQIQVIKVEKVTFGNLAPSVFADQWVI